jgi:DNA transformation protein and related proteins
VDAEAIQDLFQELGPVRVRRMFGGQGVYAGERMFALEAGGELYLKTDAESVPRFKEAGSRPFMYVKDGRATEMSYWSMPDSALDDPAEAARWGRLGIEAAVRVALAKPARKRK